MADLIVSASSPSASMTSSEIADLVGSRLDSVKRTIERLAKSEVIRQPPTVVSEKINNLGLPQTVSEYVFTGPQGKRDSIIVVAQLSPKFTARLVDRWQELEERVAKPALNPANLSRLQLIEIAMQAEQERLALEHKVEVLTPKAEALDRIATADGCLGLQAAGKALQQPPNKFVDWLRQKGWIYRRAGSSTNLGREEKVRAGYLTHKVKTVELPDGSERVCEQVMITPKGLSRLAQLFGVEPMNGNDGVTA